MVGTPVGPKDGSAIPKSIFFFFLFDPWGWPAEPSLRAMGRLRPFGHPERAKLIKK